MCYPQQKSFKRDCCHVYESSCCHLYMAHHSVACVSRSHCLHEPRCRAVQTLGRFQRWMGMGVGQRRTDSAFTSTLRPGGRPLQLRRDITPSLSAKTKGRARGSGTRPVCQVMHCGSTGPCRCKVTRMGWSFVRWYGSLGWTQSRLEMSCSA